MVNKKYSSALLIPTLVLFFCFLTYGPVSAQSVGIKISPVVLEELVEPGQVIRRQIKVTNESDTPRIFYAYLRDFGAEGETGQAKLLAPGTDYGYSIASWIKVTSEGLEFGGNEERAIDFEIVIPSDIGPGGYRGAILFGTEPPRVQVESEDRGAGMSIAQQAASLVLLRVKGDVFEEASIREFNTDKDFYSTPFSVDFLIRVENSGNVHVKPHGTISIKNMFGKEVAVVRVNEAGGNILPDSIRRFMDVKWEGKNGIGKYTATLGLSYGSGVDAGGQGKGSIVGEKSFWIIPWRIIVPVGLTLLLLSLTMFFLLRLYRNRAVKQAMEKAGVGYQRQMKKQKGASPTLHLAMIIVASFIVMLLIFVIIYIFFIA
jgi:hypothetical protein